MKKYPYAFHIALDGNGINGLEGLAGVSVFRFNPEDNSYAYKIKFYNGTSGGHAVNINPQGTCGFLGNTGQHLLFYDPETLEEIGKISTLRFEENDTCLRGSTHLVWINEREFITPISDYFYRFDINNLEKGERLGPHGVKLAHGMKATQSGKYICYGSMDNPKYGRRGAAKEVGIWDVEACKAERIELPTTCWHVTTHNKKDLFYALSFRVLPQDHVDYHEWAMAFLKEYAFEIDPENKQVVRHWSGGREIPAHINSDVTISDRELIFCTGASQTVVLIDLDNFSNFRIIDEKPDLKTNLKSKRQIGTQVYDILARGGLFTSTRHIFGALRISRFTLMDSVHACQLSKDQSLLFTANRGLNHITVYDYPSLNMRLRVPMPDLHEYFPNMSRIADPRLGFHHGMLLSS